MQFLGTTKKLASLVLWRQNEKWRKISTELTVTGPKYVRIQIFLDTLTANEQEQICVRGFMGKISYEKKFLRFENHPRVGPGLVWLSCFLSSFWLVDCSFFLSWVSKTQPNHWTKRMAGTRLVT